MKIISCAGYYGTGSSAVTDFWSEFDNCMPLTDYEFRFMQDPNGIRDLEFQLVDNHHRHTSGHALKTYKKIVDYLGNPVFKKYEFFFKGQWKKISYEFIDELTDFTFRGYWHQDVIDRGKLFVFRKRVLNKLLQKTVWRNKKEVALNELPNEITYCSHPTKEVFYECTRKYIDRLFEVANPENREYVIVDQIVPVSNLNHYLNYFNDIHVFVVDRDPRDLFLSEKYVWRGRVIPTESAELFCKWFRYTREHRKSERYDDRRIMFIQFEDFLYHYDEVAERMTNWVGVDKSHHIHPKSGFDPVESAGNTRLWERIDADGEAVSYIERELKEYLYQYD